MSPKVVTLIALVCSWDAAGTRTCDGYVDRVPPQTTCAQHAVTVRRTLDPTKKLVWWECSRAG